MTSLLIGLSLAASAAAQVVNGYSMVPVAADPVAATDSAYAAPTNTDYYGASAPAQYTGAATPVYAAPSQYTPAPSATPNIYDQLPYSSFLAGGYQSLDCGYGYTKAADGSCQALSWVRKISGVWPMHVLIGAVSTVPNARMLSDHHHKQVSFRHGDHGCHAQCEKCPCSIQQQHCQYAPPVTVVQTVTHTMTEVCSAWLQFTTVLMRAFHRR